MKRQRIWQLALLFALTLISTATFAQIKKPAKPTSGPVEKTASVAETTTDGLKLDLKAVSDTSKVRIIAYMQDGDGVNTLTWIDGYAINHSFIPKGSTNANDLRINSGISVFDKAWKQLRPEDIYDVKKVEWGGK